MRASFFLVVVFAVLIGGCASPSHDEIQSTFDAGLKAYDAGDFKTAYKTWGRIDEYDLAALRNVALMLRKGQGVDKDPKAALRKMLQAADVGLVTAEADAGEMILNGEGCPPDPAGAVPWLARAAHEGHPIAALELAKILDQGKAVPQDLKQAHQLYEIAAAAGLPEAIQRLKELDAAAPPTASPLPPTTPGH